MLGSLAAWTWPRKPGGFAQSAGTARSEPSDALSDPRRELRWNGSELLFPTIAVSAKPSTSGFGFTRAPGGRRSWHDHLVAIQNTTGVLAGLFLFSPDVR